MSTKRTLFGKPVAILLRTVPRGEKGASYITHPTLCTEASRFIKREEGEGRLLSRGGAYCTVPIFGYFRLHRLMRDIRYPHAGGVHSILFQWRKRMRLGLYFIR